MACNKSSKFGGLHFAVFDLKCEKIKDIYVSHITSDSLVFNTNWVIVNSIININHNYQNAYWLLTINTILFTNSNKYPVTI